MQQTLPTPKFSLGQRVRIGEGKVEGNIVSSSYAQDGAIFYGIQTDPPGPRRLAGQCNLPEEYVDEPSPIKQV